MIDYETYVNEDILIEDDFINKIDNSYIYALTNNGEFLVISL
jgi:hypothetical protein